MMFLLLSLAGVDIYKKKIGFVHYTVSDGDMLENFCTNTREIFSKNIVFIPCRMAIRLICHDTSVGVDEYTQAYV